VYFGNPNTTYTNPNFGKITSQINNPRLIQLGGGSLSKSQKRRNLNVIYVQR
jgi:hypothetical protein